MKRVTVVGAGLAGCEAAWQLARRGVPVRLAEMRPSHTTPAHKTGNFAELVCSNSLKGEQITGGSGLLKAEMKRLGSLMMEAAEASRVPAGGALAVDRGEFSRQVREKLMSLPGVEFAEELVEEIPEEPCVVATGPLTDPALAGAICRQTCVDALSFFDAAAPIVYKNSVNMDVAYAASRYGKGEGDYINCPMTEAQYWAFYDALTHAELAEVHDFEKKLVYEGCLAVEILAGRGPMTLAFGPLKPVGLPDPRTGKEPFAVVQLRQDDLAGETYNLVGFQTRLKFGEQKRVFRMIPGLENAEFARYGVMHRNTFLNGPKVLEGNYALKGCPEVRFAGQITGVEGYMESASSGLVAGIGLACLLMGKPEPVFPPTTMIGGLLRHATTPNPDYQPMGANFGLIDPMPMHIKGKKNRYEQLAARALEHISALAENA